MLYAPQSSVYAALLGWRHLSKIGNTVAVLITPKTHEYGARRALLYCYEKIKRLYSYYAKTFKSIILSLLGCLLTMICFEIFYSLKGQTHELHMLGKSSHDVLVYHGRHYGFFGIVGIFCLECPRFL